MLEGGGKGEMARIEPPVSNIRRPASLPSRIPAFLGRWGIIPFLGGLLGPFLLKLLARSLKIVHHGREHLETCLGKGEQVICVFWHGRILMMPFAAPGVPVAVLISRHRDGELMSRIVERLGFPVIRGSTTRGGVMAVRGMIRILRKGWNLAITPDGPKGPRWKVRAGVVKLAGMTGAPLIPLAFSASRRFVLNSWDGFLVPIPFSRGVYVWGEPLYVREGVDGEELVKLRHLLEERLLAVTNEADAYFKVQG